MLTQFAKDPYTLSNGQEILRGVADNVWLEMLIEQGQLVRFGDGTLFAAPTNYDAMLVQVKTFARIHGLINLAQTRDLFQTSRKYAQALLEELDA